MKVEILDVAGFEIAMRAMRLSWRSGSKIDTEGLKPGPNDLSLSMRLLRTSDDHGKWARIVYTWLYVNAPRYWWQEMMTYRIGADWLSSSTMHTLMKEANHPLFYQNFTVPTHMNAITCVSSFAEYEDADLVEVKANLPEGFCQDRIGAVSLQTLRRIYQQRHEHELPEWQTFCNVLEQQHPLADYIIAPSLQEQAIDDLKQQVAKLQAQIKELT